MFRIRTWVQETEYQEGGRQFFWGLRGLLRSGVGLIEAMEALARQGGDRFRDRLDLALRAWRHGIPLEEALAPMGRGDLAPGVRALVVAYCRGQPLLPFLETWLPRVERYADYRRQASQLRIALGAQCVLVAVLPWGVAAWMGKWPSPLLSFAVLLWQATGAGVIYWVSDP